MRNDGVLGNFNKHIQDNFWLYVVSLLCICIGIVIGIYTVKYMGNFQNSDLLTYLNSFINEINSKDISNKLIFVETLKNNIPLIMIIWFLGLTMIGIPIILIIDIIKGFTIGFTVSFMIGSIGMKGIWLSLLGVIPQNIIYIPCIIFVSVLSMEFSAQILKNKINKQFTNTIWSQITTYSFSFVVVTLFMFIGFFMEAYITPGIIKIVVMKIGSVVA